MHINLETFTVHKRFPLTISRGTTSQTTNIWLRIEQQGIEGWGEASPFSTGSEQGQNTELLLKALQLVVPILEKFNPWERQKIEQVLASKELPSAALAAIDMALHDWLGKQAKMPLWRLWGLNCTQIVLTSATIGINSPEGARQRVRDWLPLTGAGMLKVKLGSAEGIVADQQMFLAVKSQAPEALLSVDANGGWSLEEALQMCNWLTSQGVKYVEQPLAPGQEQDLPILHQRSPLPIFVDESCYRSCDIPSLIGSVDGINIKLMKSGGLTEAMRMVHTARACGLQVMFGCYSDSTLANTAASQLSPLADYLDLDSHLNLVDDPFTGANLHSGRLMPNNLPGLGVQHRASLY